MAKSFLDQLRMLRGGAFASDCSDEFARLLREVESSGKKGTMTIVITAKRHAGAVAVTATRTVKLPDIAPEADVFWVTDDGSLTDQNPKQRQLDLQPVQKPERQVMAS
jgi:hypothetical protein